MKKTFKKLLTASFALALAIGAGVLLGSKSNGEAKEVEAASGDNWYMIGSPSSWSTDNAFTYDTVNKFYGQEIAGRFSLTYTFKKNDEFKMRKDKDWKVSVGYGGQTGQGIGKYLDNNGGNFKVKADGTYLLTLKTDVADYDDKSYGFAIAKPYNITVKDGDVDLKTLYFEDYNNVGYTLDYSNVTKSGYNLEGLYSDSKLTVKVNDKTILKNQTMTLYSKWTKAYSKGRYITGKFGDCNWGDIEHSVIMKNDGEQFVGTIDLKLGDEVKIAWYDGAKFEDSSYVGYSNIIETAEAKFCFSAGDSDNIHCWAAGTYTFYFGFDDKKDNNSISVTYASTNAEILAAKIMSFGEYVGHCGDDDRFPAMKTMFLGLSSTEQNTFKSYEFSKESQFQNAFYRYTAWARALGEKPWENGKVTPSALSVLGINSSNSSTVIIVIVAALLTATVCAGYFFYRKKKQN